MQRDSFTVVLPKLRGGQPRNRGSIHSEARNLSVLKNRQYWLWGPPSSISVGGGVKQLGREAHHSVVSSLEVKSCSVPLWPSHGQLNFYGSC